MFVKKKSESNFIECSWLPFLETLEIIYLETKYRTEAGYELAERMPSQSEINQLTSACLLLTAEYYGPEKSNLSVLYNFLIKTSLVAGITFYSPLEQIYSDDGYVALIDRHQVQQNTAYYRQNVLEPFVRQGGRLVYGRSPIDNSIVPNVFLTEHARRLLARQGMMRAVIKFLKPIKRLDIQHWGQIAQAGRERIWQDICESIPIESHDPEYEKFVDHIYQKPGEYYDNNLDKHKTLLFQGVQENQLKILSRTTTDKMALNRYVKFKYIRLVDLYTVQAGQRILLRPAGISEIIYLRPNQGHYLREHHGLSLSTGEYHQLGRVEIPKDPAAHARTNRSPDIDWLTAEAVLLNPTVPSESPLPGETLIMVGRNAYAASSIKQTAHGQLVCAHLEQFPHFMATHDPQKLCSVDGTIDVIQVGERVDAFFIKIMTEQLRVPALIEQLGDFIIAMQLYFGENTIDFQLQIIPDKQGFFAIIMIPLAMLKYENGLCLNPSTGLSNIAENSPDCFHMGYSCGRWSATMDQKSEWLKNGKAYLQRLYDFAALSGTRDFVLDYISQVLTLNAQPKSGFN